MKKIIIDGYFLSENNPVGLHRFSSEILKKIDKYYNCSDIEIVVPSIKNIDIELCNIKISETACFLNKFGRLGMEIWKKIAFPFYVISNHGYAVDMAFAQQTIKCNVCGVFDCITLKCPENFIGIKAKVTRFFNSLRIKKSAKKADFVITLSEDAKADIIQYIDIPADKIKIIGCAWQHINDISYDDGIFDKLPNSYKKGNYFFSLGSQYYHKNMKWVLEAAKQNPNELFVVTGKKFGNLMNELNEPNIYYTGYLSDSEIKSLMKYSKAFIQPSFYEGFGIPPMEALALGRQIIISNTSSLPEIYGKSAHYIDPYNYKKINLSEILNSPVEGASSILESYSWKKSAEQFLNILREL